MQVSFLAIGCSGGYFEHTLSQLPVTYSFLLSTPTPPPPKKKKNQECLPRYNFKLNNENVYLVNFINVDPEQIPHSLLYTEKTDKVNIYVFVSLLFIIIIGNWLQREQHLTIHPLLLQAIVISINTLTF